MVNQHVRRALLLVALGGLAAPAQGDYSFDFFCRDDTVQHVEPGEPVDYHFTLANTGSVDDVYRFGLVVVESVPGWGAIYCVGGQCGEPGTIIHDTLPAGATDTTIKVSVFTGTNNGEQALRLQVRSEGQPSLADSVVVRTVVGSGIAEPSGVHPSAAFRLRVVPNPVAAHVASVEFSAPGAGRLCLVLCDISGSVIETLLDRQLAPGRHELRWQPAGDLPVGVYLFLLSTGPERAVSKVVVE